MNRMILLAVGLSIVCAQPAQADETKPASLDDLKKLHIICFRTNQNNGLIGERVAL
jgi:hypothetical protein